MTPDPTLAIVVIVLAGILIDIMFPQRGPRKWDASRAATQRDVAEVFTNRGSSQSVPRALPLVVLLVVVLGVAWVFGN